MFTVCSERDLVQLVQPLFIAVTLSQECHNKMSGKTYPSGKR